MCTDLRSSKLLKSRTFVCELEKLFNMLQLLSDAVATGAEVSVENILLKSKSYAPFVYYFFLSVISWLSLSTQRLVSIG